MTNIDTIHPTRPQADSIARRLLEWYDSEKRDLPWRQKKSPYSTLVSEFMLQQTQVQTVIPYFERFMRDLPTIQALADAPEPQVLKLWAGPWLLQPRQKPACFRQAHRSGIWRQDSEPIQRPHLPPRHRPLHGRRHRQHCLRSASCRR